MIIRDDKVIYSKTINNDVKNKLLEDLDLKKSISSFACSGSEGRTNFSNDNLTKIHVRYSTPKQTKKIWKLITEKYSKYILTFIMCHSEAIEIVSNEVNISNAIRYVAKIENLSRDKIYTIGNRESNIQIIIDFNEYAINNVVKGLKEYAKKELNCVSELINLVLSNANE